MLEKSLKCAFAVVGGITGYTVTRFVFLRTSFNLYSFARYMHHCDCFINIRVCLLC